MQLWRRLSVCLSTGVLAGAAIVGSAAGARCGAAPTDAVFTWAKARKLLHIR